MIWFLMGYTSKLAGTETGIVEPVTTFSRFFGEPFMPRNPDVYASMLGERMKAHDAEVYLVNTGWSGGPRSCPGVPAGILNPRDTWSDKKAYDLRAGKLAAEFSSHFDKAYGQKNIAPEVVSQCPGK